MRKLSILLACGLLSTGALADDFTGNPDLGQGLLNDHTASTSPTPVQPGQGDLYGSVLFREGDPEIRKCTVVRSGKGDQYASVLLDPGGKRVC